MNIKNKYILLLYFIILNISWCYITPIMFSFNTNLYPFFYYILRFFLLVLSFAFLIIISLRLIKSNLTKHIKGITSIIIIFGSTFYIIEGFFTFFAQTNGLNDTYTSVTWKYKYWKLNMQGFRDIDYLEEINKNKPIIFFVGDSYTEGHGIKYVNQRFSNIIRNKINNYSILNAGKCGWNIVNEINWIKFINVKPKYIFLQTCYNDWDYLFDKLKPVNNDVVYSDSRIIILAKYSIFANYLVSNANTILHNLSIDRVSKKDIELAIVKFKIDKNTNKIPRNSRDFFRFIIQNSNLPKDTLKKFFIENISSGDLNTKVMMDTTLFRDYLDKLVELNNFCKSNQIVLIIVPFPSFDREGIMYFEDFTYNYLLEQFRMNKLQTINLLPDLRKSNLKKYRVNKYDAHANEKSNYIISNTIIDYINNELDIN
jgi:hypothetical protein